MSTDPDPLLLGEWLARYRFRLKYGSANQLEAINKLRAILGLEADAEDVKQKAELCMERLALSFSKKVEGFVITPTHVEHLFTVQPGQTKAAISEEDFMANFCTPVYWDSKVPEDMLPVMKRLYGHETGLDVDDPDGYGYGVSTYHFNSYIAGLVAEIDKSFSYVPYIGFSRTIWGQLFKKSCRTPPRAMASDRSHSSASPSSRAPRESPCLAIAGAGSSCTTQRLLLNPVSSTARAFL